ncbi:complement C1q-like protein 4 [Mercenaria mercenaria]|uniref:complement C1q-like protein 4 n=1 Tax=Mercenaria mercenaria TaxID=6596 RepID=UPI00234F740C|nr:complement C1q-like protein 4 [Mercenaria mercenaria]
MKEGRYECIPTHLNQLTDKPMQNRCVTASERAGVSFSVYLDHDLDLGTHQTIKFNQVIINDGNGYNIYTGVFTCPESGVYMFSFFIGGRSETSTPTGEYAQLMVNDQHVIDAVVDTFHSSQDLQGGNTVIKRLKQGDAVWIGSLAGHVEGRPGLRISTFSDVYLYP